jgi:G protein-coupled receptor GPR1
MPATDNYNEASMNADLERAYRKVRRELRMLFIYPATYLLTWSVPFISHCFQYSDYYARHPPFVITCIATTMTVLQCAVDCIIFTLREKVHLPRGRHLPGPYCR